MLKLSTYKTFLAYTSLHFCVIAPNLEKKIKPSDLLDKIRVPQKIVNKP